MKKLYNIAVILAGGTGSRVGDDKPKQLLPLADGRSILEHSIDAFEASPHIDEIAVVMHPDHISSLQKLCQSNHWLKLTKIIPGGTERWESSWHAILAYMASSQSVSTQYDQSAPSPWERGGERCLWFHDAARPFVSQRIIDDVASALETHNAVTVAVPVTDTIYEISSLPPLRGGQVGFPSLPPLRGGQVGFPSLPPLKGGAGRGSCFISAVPPRQDFMRAQTPQAFRLDIIAEAFRRAMEKGGAMATDDVGIVHRFMPEQTIFIIAGEESNRKITYKEDLAE